MISDIVSKAGNTYRFRARACNTNGCGDYTAGGGSGVLQGQAQDSCITPKAPPFPMRGHFRLSNRQSQSQDSTLHKISPLGATKNVGLGWT